MLPINPNGRGRISDARVHLHAYPQQHARVHILSAYIVPRNGINRGSSRSRRVKARLRAKIGCTRRRNVPRERTLVSGVLMARLRYPGDGQAGRSNLSAAIIPDNYVKCKNTERERER